MVFFVYFIIFNIMGRDYDVVVMLIGYCGFGLGVILNVMVNMEIFIIVNGLLVKVFFIILIVGLLFIDFINVGVI